MTTPAASPSHHVSQISPCRAGGANPPMTNADEPIVAFTKQLVSADSKINTHTERTCSKGCSRVPNFLSKYTPKLPSIDAPMPIASATPNPIRVKLGR